MKYFQPVDDFESSAPVSNPPPALPEPVFPTDFKSWISKVDAEIELFKTGQSKVRPGALYLGKSECPAVAAIQRFSTSPTKDNLKFFFAASLQDFGLIATRTFWAWIKEEKPEIVHFRGIFNG